MTTVFSHIIQKQFSRQNENVATEALAYILNASEGASNGLLKLLRGIEPALPRLWVRTQQSEDNKRPDMWGYDEKAKPQVFVENKFWASLTGNQPVEYLKTLANYAQPTILLVVAPDARRESLWREFECKMEDAKLKLMPKPASAGVSHMAETDIGPILALTSWGKLLTCLEAEMLDDQVARNDLDQLRALCEAADSDAFVPIMAEQAGDHRTPALMLQLSSVVMAAIDLAVRENVLNLKGTLPQASSGRIGRYALFGEEHRAGLWMGIHFDLWRKHGSPLWAYFHDSAWGRGREVRALLEPWAAHRGIFTTSNQDGFAVVLDIIFGGDKDEVVRAIAHRLKEMGAVLSVLKGKTAGAAPNG